ncbi:RNA-binding protein 6-like isoform X2 [Bufo bufo]|uniref:RNA-binding protein 6-like isoform X2 n=1 Tax=Bufo bufo TaxID=8384 RepID=UPI001ABEB0F8|nr:RNA-binding protein 6-like isoform X2 [Bufo bufo]
MWNPPRQLLPGFRGHPGEPFPPRIPPGSYPRMRGRPSFPFREGPRVSSPHFGGPGVAPFMHRNMDVSMDGHWEEGRMLPEEQLHLSRRPRPNINYRAFREEELMDMHYGDMGGPENELRSRLAPDMDYREREASILSQRGVPDVDYRHEEEPAIVYRERLPPPSVFRESLEYRRRLQAVEQLRQRTATPLDYSEREMEELEYKRRLDALQEIVLRQRESAELLSRDREVTDMRDRELRERSALGYNERAVPAHFRESADLDLRFREPDVDVNFLDQDRALDYRERMVIDYSHSETMMYSETEGPDYMESEYKAGLKSQSNVIPKGVAGITRRDLKSADAPEPPYKKRNIEIPGIDSDYREKESADSDYRGKETSDSDYRDNTDSDYREMEAADSDYRDKESADSDYRERERADADYRKPADNGMKKSANTMEAKDNASKPVKNSKEPKAVMTAPDLGPKPLSSTEPRVPFLSYDKPQVSPISKINNEALRQEGALSALKGGVKSDKCSFPGKLDVDFRDHPKPELNQETKEAGNKITRFSTGGKELCPSDQDLRSKEPAQGGGDQDFRTSKYVQKKDEDLRAGKEQASADPLSQSSLLYDFLTLAAKELKQQKEKVAAGNETEGQAAVHIPEKPATARTSHPASSTTKSAAGPSPGVEFLGRQDADYRNKDYMDVDLRVASGADKKSHDDHQPGSKDKDYRRTTIPDGATRIVWLDGLPTGASREDILSALGAARPLPKDGVNLIGYIPGYSFGSVCVEFSLVEEAVGCMEANKGVLNFRGKKISLKYIPNSDRWSCQQCKGVNVLSKERCWQCSALRAGSDHLPVREALKDAKTPILPTSRRAKKRNAKPSPPVPSRNDSKRRRSPPPKGKKGGKPAAKAESATVIIRGIGVNTTPNSVVKALQPYVQLSVRSIRIMKNRKSDHRGFGFIDLRNHKEAIRLTVLVRELKPPLTIDGKPISVDLAVGERRNEQRKSQKGNRSSAKARNRRAQRRSITYPGFKAAGPSYVYNPKTGMYVDPLTKTVYSGNRNQRKKDDQAAGGGKKQPSSQPRRGFTEDKVKDSDKEPFKRPLPPPVTKKEEPPLEPKHNPLIKLLGEYGDDSEEEEEEEVFLPPIKKKPAPPPPAPAPKPAAPTFSPIAVHQEKLTDWSKMICLLCRRQFPNKDALIRHQKLSDLHKQNLAIQEKVRKSQKGLAFLKEQEENQSIQRRLLQARKELEMLERQEEGAQQEREGLDSEVQAPGNKKPKGSDPGSEPKVKRQAGASYRDNMKRRILERYKELE